MHPKHNCTSEAAAFLAEATTCFAPGLNYFVGAWGSEALGNILIKGDRLQWGYERFMIHYPTPKPFRL